MLLIETLALEVGASIAKSVLRVWLKDADIAVGASESIIDVLKARISDEATQQHAQRIFDEIGQKAGKSLLSVFQREGANLDDGSRKAIAFAVKKTLNTVSSEVLARHNLNASRLAHSLLAHPVAAQHFNEAEESLFSRIISESCLSIVDIASQLPSFTERTFAEVLEREDQIRQDIERVLRRFDEIAEEKRAEAARKQAERRILIEGARFDPDEGEIRRRLSHFVGRVQEYTELLQQIHQMSPTGGYLLVTAPAGQGKSSLIAKLVQEMSSSSAGTAYHFISVKAGITYQVKMLRDLIAQLLLHHNLPEEYDQYLEDKHSEGLSSTFRKVLQEVAARREQAVLFLDGLDQFPEEPNGGYDLDFLPPESNPGIIFVLATRPTHILEEVKTQIGQQHEEYSLRDLSRNDFTLLLNDRGANLTGEVADQFYKSMQRNALFLDQAAQAVQKKAATPEEILKHVADDPSKIFSLTIKRLEKLSGWRGWKEVLKPMLGVFLVVQEPLTARQMRDILRLDSSNIDTKDVREGLFRLGGLVAGTERYILFHPKLYEYLRRDLFIDEEKEWHQKLVEWCEGERGRDDIATIWQEARAPEEQERREYARQHYVTHLYHAQEWERLFEVLDEQGYGKAKIQYDPSTRSYAQDLNWGRQAAASASWGIEQGIRYLAHLWRYTLLQCSLAYRAYHYPAAAFALMARLGYEAKAIGLTEFITEPEEKAARLLMIAANLSRQSGRGIDAERMFLQIREVIRLVTSASERVNLLIALASLLTSRGWQEEAEPVWAEAIENCASIIGERQKAELLRELALTLINEGRQEDGRRVLAMAEQASASILSEYEKVTAVMELARTLLQVQQWTAARRVIASIPFDHQRIDLLLETASALAQAGEPVDAQQVFAEVEQETFSLSEDKAGPRAERLAQLATALAQAGQREDAQRILREAKQASAGLADDFWKRSVFSKLATALIQLQQWKEAEQVIFSFLKSEGDRNSLLETDGQREVIALTESLAQHALWDDARRVIASIPYEDTRASALVKFTAALARHEYWDEARQVANDIVHEGVEGRVRALFYGTHDMARSQALAAIADAFIDHQRWEDASQVIASIPDEHVRSKALQRFGTASVLSLPGGEQQAWEAIQDLDRDLRLARFTAGIFAMYPDKEERVEKLIETADELAERGLREDAKLVWQAVERESVSIPYEIERVEALITLAVELFQPGRQDDAQRLWKEAERVSKSLERGKAEALSKIAHSFIQQRQWEEAERVSRSIPDTLTSARALIALASALYEARLEDAHRVGKIAEEVAISIPTSNHDGEKVRVLLDIATFYVLAGQIEDARYAQAEAEKISTPGRDGNKYPEVAWMNGLKTLATAYIQQQQWTEAEQISASISAEYQRVEALIALATAFHQAGRQEDEQRVWTEAIQTCISMRNVNTLITLASALQEAGRQEESRQTWTEAIQASASISDGKRRTEALIDLATALHQAGYQEDEKQAWAEATQVCAPISDRKQKGAALITLATALYQAGYQGEAGQMWQEAEQVSASLADGREKTEMLLMLVLSFVRAARWEEVRRLWTEAEQAIDSFPPSQLLVDLVRAFAKQRHWEEAERVGSVIPYYTDLYYHTDFPRIVPLVELAQWLAASDEDERLLRLIQRWWTRATNREEAFIHLPLAYNLLYRCPDLALQFSDAFTQVDAFLGMSTGAEEAPTLNLMENMVAHLTTDRPQDVQRLLEQALPHVREEGNRAEEAQILASLAMVCLVTGQRAEALRQFKQALHLTKEVDDRAGEAMVLTNMAVMLYPQEAIANLEQALDILRSNGLTQNAAGQTAEEIETLLQEIQSFNEGLNTIIDEIMTASEEDPAKLREFIAQMIQDAPQDDNPVAQIILETMVEFFTAILAILDGQSPSLAADHPYALALAAIQSGIANGGLASDDAEIDDISAEKQVFVQVCVAALRSPDSQEKMAFMQQLIDLQRQAPDDETKPLFQSVQFALVGGDLVRLGDQLTGFARQMWELIIAGVQQDDPPPENALPHKNLPL